MNVFAVDWTDLKAVKRVADLMASPREPQSVIKHDSRPNYNITHTRRRDLIDVPGVVEIYVTRGT